jgi:hypothetical protein
MLGIGCPGSHALPLTHRKCTDRDACLLPRERVRSGVDSDGSIAAMRMPGIGARRPMADEPVYG